MRNLKNIRRTAKRFDKDNLPLTALTWDTSAENTLICAFGPTSANALVELKRLKAYARLDAEYQVIASWDVPCPDAELPCHRILDLHYFADTAVACLIFASGDIVIIREQPLPGEELLEIVGSVDAGISAAAWSPDEELLAICAKDEKFLLMSRDFDPLADVSFSPEDAKLSKHVSVGWGKVETQFKGKRAKALRDPTVPEKVDEGLLSAHDKGDVTISWRGDGAFVAVNSVEAKTKRMIRVYSRDGVLDSVSEPVDYLEGALSWRPAGNLISGIQRQEDGLRVVFFERNGLRHGEFDLRVSKEEIEQFGFVVSLDWNTDSTVLAVTFSVGGHVQLWTMGNYHYYQKQELFADTTVSRSNVCWHPEQPLRLAVYSPHRFYIGDYVSTVSRGPTISPFDTGLVNVVDGKVLKITPLRSANVPPPMALHEIQIDCNIIDVACSGTGRYIALLTRSFVAVYDTKHLADRIATRSYSFKFNFDHSHGQALQVSFGNDTELFTLLYDEDESCERVYHISFEDENGGKHYEHEEIFADSESRASLLIPGQGTSTVLLEDSQGAISELEEASIQTHTQVAKLPMLCPIAEIVQLNGSFIAFGLSSTGQLFANSRRLLSNCTSFVVTASHLIMTTSNHLLKFVHLTDVDTLEVPADEPETDERCRSIERGAKLVTVMPSAYSLVLQMPRGNLETIYPRALVLAAVRKNIKEKDYKKAFMTCRSQRVDMNILYDYAPLQFMQDVELFIKQIQKVEHIDLFLSQIRDENTTQTIYKETLREESVPRQSDTHSAPHQELKTSTAGSKVNAICDAFLKALSGRVDTNLQNIITAYVCKVPPDLEGGLKIVSQLRKNGDELAERAAEHICFLADVNQLYDHALGMYELELTVLIAQQSQKDPREYLPYLQELQNMEPLRRQFNIDNDLGRKQKALQSLHALGSFDDFKQYAEKHELYSAAIELCKYQPERLKSLVKAYADYLAGRNRYRDAGIAYEYVGDYASAIPAYRSANLWRQALSCASILPLAQNELMALARDLADGLTESKDYQSAGIIYLEYLSDVELAARLFCKAYLFANAMRIVTLSGRPELLTEVVDPGIIESFNSTTELLADCRSQLAAQVPRLRELRLKKEQDPLAFYGGESTNGKENGDIPDDISLAPTDASTAGTFMTRYTKRTDGTLASNASRKTSKNRRREERKRARGKKGSVYEEEYLINSIGRLIERVNSVGDDVARLAESLMRRTMREQALNVERSMSELVQKCKEIVPEVWQVEQEKKDEDSDVPTGADGVLWEATTQGTRMSPPIVKAFERLSLLE